MLTTHRDLKGSNNNERRQNEHLKQLQDLNQVPFYKHSPV